MNKLKSFFAVILQSHHQYGWGEKDWRRLGGSKKLGVKNVTPFSSLTVSDGSLEKICY